MLKQYEALLTSHCVREHISNSYECLTERHLQALWLEQKYFRPLLNANGQQIEVISPGIWNADAGPDFLKAHLRIGQQDIFGDIELHLRPESWIQHGHHADHRYDNVILHVSYWRPAVEAVIQTVTGRKIPQTFFAGHLTIPPGRILKLIDLDLYPYKRFVGSGKCAQTVFRTLPEKETREFFQQAAYWRLAQKRIYLLSHLEDESQLMAGGIAMGLGYKNNSQAFLELYLALRKLVHLNEETLFALAMKGSGFFEERYKQKWKDSDKYKELCQLAESHQAPNIKVECNQIRPLNHPIRRFVVLAKMLRDKSIESLFNEMHACWTQEWKQGKWRTLWKQLCEHLPSYTDEYWNWHFSFENHNSKEFLPLLGETLKGEILVNTFLPLLYDKINGNPQELEAFQEFFAAFPAAKKGKTEYLIHRFFGDTPKGKVLQRADTEQGAYQLHRDFCFHYEASCDGCPFIERFKALK